MAAPKQRHGLDFALGSQMIDPLPDDLAEIRRRQPVRDLQGLGAKLSELFVQAVKTGANSFVVLQIPATRQNIVVDFFQALGESSALLAEGLP